MNASTSEVINQCFWQGDPRKYRTYLATRPKSFEAKAVRMLIELLRVTRHQPMKPGFVLLTVHLANADLLKEIRQAQQEGGFLCKAEFAGLGLF